MSMSMSYEESYREDTLWDIKNDLEQVKVLFNKTQRDIKEINEMLDEMIKIKKRIDRSEYMSEWRENNRDKCRALSKTYYEQHKEAVKERCRERYRNMSAEQKAAYIRGVKERRERLKSK